MRYVMLLSLLVVGCGSSKTAGAIHACNDGDFVSGSAVGFGGEAGSDTFGYKPRCLKIAANSAVTFSGGFSTHPLHGGLAPGETGSPSAGNPIGLVESGTSKSVTFTTAGTYPYFCDNHFGGGMKGVVRVE